MEDKVLEDANLVLVNAVLTEMAKYSEKNGSEKVLKFLNDNKEIIEKEFHIRWTKMV